MLQPGLSQKEIDLLINEFPFKLTDEVSSFYKWRNGLSKMRSADYELLPEGYLLAFDEALNYYRMAIETAARTGRLANIDPSQLWDPRWIPILENLSGDFYVILCDKEKNRQSPVYYVHNEDRESTYMAYDSLTSMILTIAKCYETGGYSIGFDGKVRENYAIVAQIVREFNPKRFEELTKDL